MTEQFKIGEIAIVQNCENFSHLNGEECTVTGALDFRYSKDFFGNTVCDYSYQVHCRDGYFSAQPNNLRKRNPPSTGEQIIRDMFIPVNQPELEPA